MTEKLPRLSLVLLLSVLAKVVPEPYSRRTNQLIDQAEIKFLGHLALTFTSLLTIRLHSTLSAASSAIKPFQSNALGPTCHNRTSNCIFVRRRKPLERRSSLRDWATTFFVPDLPQDWQ